MPDPIPLGGSPEGHVPPAVSRRDFVATSSALAAWIAMSGGALASLAACAREDAATEAAFRNLTPAQGRAVRAFANQVLPSVDGRPGAEAAGAAWFVDRAIVEWMPPMRGAVEAGAEALDAAAAGGVFADLDDAAQIALMRDVENEPWFGALHMLVMVGVFAEPSYGGNRDDAGFRLVGIERATAFQPPFGYYDAEYAKTAGGDA